MKNILFLFDIDGTLTLPRKVIGDEMKNKLLGIKNTKIADVNISIGVVGGSDLPQQREQLEDAWDYFDYQFSENGLIYYKDGVFIESTSFVNYLGQDKMNELIDICLEILSRTKCPEKTGTFIESRSGMLNISPVGRSCTDQQRLRFFEYDNIHHVRDEIKKEIEVRFAYKNNIKISIGGQISMDIFPNGWDKTFCLKYVAGDFDEIHFFGDRTEVGGNDYEIFHDKRVIGHTVTDPIDTIRQIDAIINTCSNN